MRFVFIIILVLSGCKTTTDNSVSVLKQNKTNIPFG